jgi:norsolorinic acid ketoreductase
LSSASSTSLTKISTTNGSKVITVAIDSSIDTSAKEAVDTLKTQHGIKMLDVVIANAGISKYYGLAEITPVEEVREHFEVNTIGVLTLFQATLPLLKKAPDPVFMALSTGICSIGDMGSLPLPVTAYGISKVALNYMVRKIHFENPGLIAFVISPGYVQSILLP